VVVVVVPVEPEELELESEDPVESEPVLGVEEL
jgi:hypothetical protein